MDLKETHTNLVRRHPWEVARARFYTRVLADAGLLDVPRSALDVGAGDGYLARTLLDALPAGSAVVCLDAYYTDDDLRRFAMPPRPGLAFEREPPARRFDVLLLLDVLEHVEDDLGFLTGFVGRNAAPGGVVLVGVPAWPSLFSRHDEALGHVRRYTPAACRELLAKARLSVRASGGLFHALLLPRVLACALERGRARGGRAAPAPAHIGEWRGGKTVSTALERVLALDSDVSRALGRLGVSVPRPELLGALRRWCAVSTSTLVVPCYNEAARLDGPALVGLVDAHPSLRLVLVDDGSTDGTEARLRAVAAERPARIEVLRLPEIGARRKRCAMACAPHSRDRVRSSATSTPTSRRRRPRSDASSG
jgi:SAM-dependent methyltransferase